VSGTTASTPLAKRAANRPVGLKALAFFGYPVQRTLLRHRAVSAYLIPVLSVVLLSLITYLVGLILAWHYGLVPQFVASPLVPCAIVATAWGDLMIAWAAIAYENWGIGTGAGGLESTTYPFVHLAEPARAQLRRHWERLCDLRLAARYAIPVVAAAMLYVVLAVYLGSGNSALVPASVRHLYGSPNAAFWMFAYLVAVIAILANTGAFGLFFTFEHLRFVSEFVKDEMAVVLAAGSASVKHLYLAHRPLEEISRASFLSSIAWFGEIGVLAAVLVVELNGLTLLILAVLIGVGVYVFVRPQWEAHKLIQAAKTMALRQLESNLPPDWYDPAKGVPRQDALPLLAMLHNVAATSEWHIDIRLVFVQVMAALFPIVAAYAGGPLGLRLA